MLYLERVYSIELGEFRIHYEDEPGLDDETRRWERELAATLREPAERYNAIARRIDENGFPDLCPPNYLRDEDLPLWTLADHQYAGIKQVPCSLVVGTNWANLPLAEVRPYPYHRKIREILTGYLNLNDEGQDTCSTMEPIDLYHLYGDVYVCGEGNHRLYTARLLGMETIRAEVWEYDYVGLLRKAIVLERYEKLGWGNVGLERADSPGVYQMFDLSLHGIERLLHLKQQLA